MPFIHISNGTIEDISRDRGNTFVTVTYVDNRQSRRTEQTVRLLVGQRTIILNANGVNVSVNALRVGMLVNAAFSSTMTRSNPPQAEAYIIEIVSRQERDEMATGTILDIDRGNRSFTTIQNRNLSSIIRFHASEDTLIFDRSGRRINFSRLMPGMRVRVRHANFMTASIPPQTTAFEVRIL